MSKVCSRENCNVEVVRQSKCWNHYYEDNKELIKKRCRQWRLDNPEAQRKPLARLKNSKIQALKRGVNWDITIEQYESIFKLECYYCNGILGSRHHIGSGLDRISFDKTIGYTISNVLPCCGTCNAIRGDNLTVEETKAAITAVVKLRKKSKRK